MFSLASARNAAPIQVSSDIAASLPSRVISHLGLDIPIVQRATWARQVVSAAVTLVVEVTAAQMPQVIIARRIRCCHAMSFVSLQFASLNICRCRKCSLVGNSK
jgi:hypothetical protein